MLTRTNNQLLAANVLQGAVTCLTILFAFVIALTLTSCTPKKAGHVRETAVMSKNSSMTKRQAAPKPGLRNALANDEAEPRTTPCADYDDACLLLPRERAEFSEATYTNEGQPVIRFDRDSEDLAFFSEFPKTAEIDRNLAAFLQKDLVTHYEASLRIGRNDRARALKLGVDPKAYKKIVIERVWAVTARSPALNWLG